MRVTAQEEYGLRCIMQVARSGPQGYSTIPEMAERECLTSAYVGKLMRVLRKAKLVKSIRGPKGGFQLIRPPDQISVGEVLAALGGRLYSTEFCDRYRGKRRECVHSIDCSLRSLWVGVERLVEGVLGQCRLSDLDCSEEAMSSWIGGRVRVERGVAGCPEA